MRKAVLAVIGVATLSAAIAVGTAGATPGAPRATAPVAPRAAVAAPEQPSGPCIPLPAMKADRDLFLCVLSRPHKQCKDVLIKVNTIVSLRSCPSQDRRLVGTSRVHEVARTGASVRGVAT